MPKFLSQPDSEIFILPCKRLISRQEWVYSGKNCNIQVGHAGIFRQSALLKNLKWRVFILDQIGTACSQWRSLPDDLISLTLEIHTNMVTKYGYGHSVDMVKKQKQMGKTRFS